MKVCLKSSYEIANRQSARYNYFQLNRLPVFIVLGNISCAVILCRGTLWSSLFSIICFSLISAIFWHYFVSAPRKLLWDLFNEKAQSTPPVNDDEELDDYIEENEKSMYQVAAVTTHRERTFDLTKVLFWCSFRYQCEIALKSAKSSLIRVSSIGNQIRRRLDPRKTSTAKAPEGLGVFPMEIWLKIMKYADAPESKFMMINKTFCDILAPNVYSRFQVLLTINSSHANKDRKYNSLLRGAGYQTSSEERYQTFKEYQSALVNDVEFIDVENLQEDRDVSLNLIANVDIFQRFLDNVLMNPNSYFRRYIKNIYVDFNFLNLSFEGIKEKHVALGNKPESGNFVAVEYSVPEKVLISTKVIDGFHSQNIGDNGFCYKDYLIHTAKTIPELFETYTSDAGPMYTARDAMALLQDKEDADILFHCEKPRSKRYEGYEHRNGGWSYDQYGIMDNYQDLWSSFSLKKRSFRTLDETSNLINKTLETLSSDVLLGDAHTSTLLVDNFREYKGAQDKDEGSLPQDKSKESFYTHQPIVNVLNKFPAGYEMDCEID